MLGTTGVGILGLGVVSGSSAQDEETETETETATETETDTDTESDGYDVDEILDDWDEEAVEVVQPVLDEYGDPDEAVPSRLIWHHEDDDAPWKETVMFRDSVPHNFPVEHPDYLEQSIDLQIPTDQYDEVATYDGSVMLERTKGEVSARCDKEEMNLLAINLTYELVNSDMTVEDARRAYAEDAMAFMDGEEPPRTQELQFDLPEGDQRDPDVTVIQDGEIQLEQDAGTTTDGGEEETTTTEDGEELETTTTDEGM